MFRKKMKHEILPEVNFRRKKTRKKSSQKIFLLVFCLKIAHKNFLTRFLSKNRPQKIFLPVFCLKIVHQKFLYSFSL